MKSKRIRLDALGKAMAKKNLLLKKNARNLVFGKGNPHAAIVFIGEAPGEREDEQALPFVGTAGKTLDRLLHLIGFTLEDVYITNILKYRPPNNRNPRVEEIIDHTPYLIEQIKIIEPKAIVPLGNFATRFILSGFNIEKMGTILGISKLHGQIKKINFENYEFLVVPLYHPAAALYNPSLGKTLEKDIKNLKKIFQKN